jgi:hypothetical protein
LAHHHGGSGGSWPSDPCVLSSMGEVISAGSLLYDLLLKTRSLLSSDLDVIMDVWEYLALFDAGFHDHYYERCNINKKEYCEVGGRVACLELPVHDGIRALKSELRQLLPVPLS